MCGPPSSTLADHAERCNHAGGAAPPVRAEDEEWRIHHDLRLEEHVSAFDCRLCTVGNRTVRGMSRGAFHERPGGPERRTSLLRYVQRMPPVKVSVWPGSVPGRMRNPSDSADRREVADHPTAPCSGGMGYKNLRSEACMWPGAAKRLYRHTRIA